MATVNPEERAAFIAALRDLAGFLEGHPDVPVPESWHTKQITVFPDGDTDEQRRAGVDAAAGALGVTAADPDGSGHYQAARRFGSLAYQVLAISDARRAAYDAGSSYYDCVTPDSPQADV